MLKYISLYVLSFFDNIYQKKIFKFLKSKQLTKFNIFFDVGGHKGESIDLYLRNLKIKKIYSFEASPINFKTLQKSKNLLSEKYKDTEIFLENIALGSSSQTLLLKQSYESSSSTLNQINEDSNYFKKKTKFLKLFKKNLFFQDIKVDVITLEDYLNKKNISSIDFLKIDTEGYEYKILLGLKNKIKNVRLIFFEHHYDDMIKKNYKFNDINTLLKKNNFNKIFKLKMPFRKTFEYIYINRDLI